MTTTDIDNGSNKGVLTRRALLIGGGVAIAGGATFAATWFNIFADATLEGKLSVEAALHLATQGEILLIDIRRPDEWQKTGIGAPAIPIDMRRDDFEVVLANIRAKRGDKPVALICARGVRSRRMDARLKKAGFQNILDVPEGMLGSGAGDGWLKKGLPLRQPTQDELAIS